MTPKLRMPADNPKDVTVTNDGATILSLLDVEHPAGKILVDLAHQQDKEVRKTRTHASFSKVYWRNRSAMEPRQ